MYSPDPQHLLYSNSAPVYMGGFVHGAKATLAKNLPQFDVFAIDVGKTYACSGRHLV